MYAVKPTIDPNTIRYPTATQERAEIALRCSAPTSPETIPAIHKQTPPAKLCIATPSKGEPGPPACLEYTDPLAHASEAITRIPTPKGSTRPDPPRFLGPTRSANPPNPNSSPANTRSPGRVPPGRSQSTKTIHNETVATSSAVTPEGTVRSARHTPPFPMNSSKKPVMKDIRQCAAVGRTPVFQRNIGYRMRPVNKCREPASNSGGNDSIPTRIARYVDPQTTYTSPNAIITNVEVREARGLTAGGAGSCSSMAVDILTSP